MLADTLHAILLLPLEVPEFPDETPWWAVWWYWLLSSIIVGAPTLVAVLLTRRHNKKELKETKDSLEVVKEQVANTHETNLREDLDKVAETGQRSEKYAADANANARLAMESSSRTERLVDDMLKTLSAIEHSMDRRDRLHAEAMTELEDDLGKVREDLREHLEDVPRLVDSVLERHQLDCPLFQDRDKPVGVSFPQ